MYGVIIFFPSPHPNPNITNYLPTKKNSLKECSLQIQIKEGDAYDLIKKTHLCLLYFVGVY